MTKDFMEDITVNVFQHITFVHCRRELVFSQGVNISQKIAHSERKITILTSPFDMVRAVFMYLVNSSVHVQYRSKERFHQN